MDGVSDDVMLADDVGGEDFGEVDLFAEEDFGEDFAADEVTDEGDAGATQEGSDGGQTDEQSAGQADGQDEPVLEVPLNGQMVRLTREQAAELAQKGVTAQQQLEQVRQQQLMTPERMLLEQLAIQAGMEYEQFLSTFQSQMQENAIRERAALLVNEEFMDEQAALVVARTELENRALRNQQQAAQQQMEQRQRQAAMEQQLVRQRREAFNQEIGELVRENPGFEQKYPTVESMPEVMQRAIREGGSIRAAYQQVMIEELSAKVAAYEQNQSNAGRSPGSARGQSGQEMDGFVGALFSED